MKKLIVILATLMLISLLCSCSGKEYRTDYSCRTLCDYAVEAAGDGEEYSVYEDSFFEYSFSDDMPESEDRCVSYSTRSENINEIGIFLVSNKKDAKEAAEECREYIEEMQEDKRAFIASYAPAELPKLDRAEVRIYGSYVVYTILDNDSREAVYKRIEEALRK